MISEIEFARTYSSFWQELLPMGAKFVRRLNIQYCERFSPPLESDVDPARRALVNEIGFSAFKVRMERAGLRKQMKASSSLLKKLAEAGRDRIERLRRTNGQALAPATPQELSEALELSHVLLNFYECRERGQPMVLPPYFPGCGFVDSSIGDVLAGRTLYEVKAGDRTFRLSDLKQLLVYSALNEAARRYEIERLAILNPRQGIFFRMELDRVCQAMAGLAGSDLLHQVIVFISGGGVSK